MAKLESRLGKPSAFSLCFLSQNTDDLDAVMHLPIGHAHLQYSDHQVLKRHKVSHTQNVKSLEAISLEDQF